MKFQMNRCRKFLTLTRWIHPAARSQLQTANNVETMGIASYQHVFSSNAVADFRGMVRDNENDFDSNAYSTPIEIFQHNWFREGYFKARSASTEAGTVEGRVRNGQHVAE